MRRVHVVWVRHEGDRRWWEVRVFANKKYAVNEAKRWATETRIARVVTYKRAAKGDES